MIVDNLVCDVKDFISHHPGGSFVLRNLLGTDVSKFFFGGYSLENNKDKARGHTHSVYARMIVNDLAIAHYEKDTCRTFLCE